MAAEAFYFLFDQKVTKNQVIKEASFAHKLLPCSPAKTRAAIILPLCRTMATASVKTCYALCHALGHQFYQSSSEAYLLPVLEQNGNSYISEE